MTTRTWHSTTVAALLGALASMGCSEDDGGSVDGNVNAGGNDGDAASGSGGGSGGGAGGSSGGDSGGMGNTEGCTVTLSPSDDDATALLGAFIDSSPNEVICLNPGTYVFSREVTHVGVEHVTLKGVGATRDDVVLDFANQVEGDNAAEIDADYFTIQDLTVKDAPGDGVKVTNSQSPVFRNVRAYWSRGPSPDNGTYALYPAECADVLIEDCEVSGAADAGIYLGQSSTGVVRRNVAFQNVIGIEAENSEYVELYENEAYDNSVGMLIVNLPELVRKQNEIINVHDNIVRDNDHANFAHPGAFVEGVPPGSGIIVMASDKVDIHANTIQNNDGVGVLVVSWPTFSAVGGFNTTDTEYEQYAESVYVHSNTYSGNGDAPTDVYAVFATADGKGYDVAWDGALDPAADPATANERRFCLQENAATTFLNLSDPLPEGGTFAPVSDLTPYDCNYPAQAPVTLD